MFRKLIVIAVAAACLTAAAWLVFGFTQEKSAPRVGNFLAAETAVCRIKPTRPAELPAAYPHGTPLSHSAYARSFRIAENVPIDLKILL